jgi:hypothetical protein
VCLLRPKRKLFSLFYKIWPNFRVLATCNTKADEELCKAGGDSCEFVIDGYYISAGMCTLIGLIWFRIFYSRIQYFQKIPRGEWRVIKSSN